MKALLEAAHPDLTFRVETMKTIGDKILDVALAKIGTTPSAHHSRVLHTHTDRVLGR